jgi:hypothetical protein
MLKTVIISGLVFFVFFCHYGCTAKPEEPKATARHSLLTRKDSGYISGNHSLTITATDAIIEQVNVPDSLIIDSVSFSDSAPAEPSPVSKVLNPHDGAGTTRTTGSDQRQENAHAIEREVRPAAVTDGMSPVTPCPADDTIGSPATRDNLKDSLAGNVGSETPIAGRVSQKELYTGFFTSGFNLTTLVLLIILIFTVWQLKVLARRVSRLNVITGRLYSRSKSQRIIKDIAVVCKRLEKIESDIGSLMARVPVDDAHVESVSDTGNTMTATAITGGKENAGSGDDEKKPLDEALKPTGNDHGESPVARPAGDSGTTGKYPGRLVFYMPSPDNEGNFDNRKKSNFFIPSESIYEFILDENSDGNASFSIYQDRNNMERAINYYSSILDKVCRGQNAFNPHGKTIKTIKPGYAVLNNNKWVVKEKALVRYE